MSKSIKRGEIYWVDLDPSLGSEASRVRPALVVSSDANNELMPLISVSPITSSVHRIYRFEVYLKAGEGGLTRDSKVQIPQTRAVNLERIQERIGTVNQNVLLAVSAALKLHFDLD